MRSPNPSKPLNHVNLGRPRRRFACKGLGRHRNMHASPSLRFSACYEPRIVGAGFLNIGNTCFLNAVLQCLVHTVPLALKLRASTHYSSCRRRPGGCEFGEFCSLCALKQQVDDCLYMTGYVIAPRRFAANLDKISSCFLQGQQEDAHEFLHALLDSLHSCCLNRAPMDRPPSLEEDSLINQVFGGRLRSQLRCCDCGYLSNTYEPLLDLSLEIDDNETIMEALWSFMRTEKIDDPEIRFKCEGCKADVSVEKQLKLDRAPQVLILHLKRFKSQDYFVRKINEFVHYPMELDLSPFLSSPVDGEQLKYELYAFIVHVGHLSYNGHYVSFIRSSENLWQLIDDAHVHRVSECSVDKQRAYILFYIKKGSSPWFSSIMEKEKALVGCAEMDSTANTKTVAKENAEPGSDHHTEGEGDEKENGQILKEPND